MIKTNSSKINSQSSGFTIVELLIVVVVIGILATVTIVAFNGMQNKARITLIESDLTNSAKALEVYKTSTSGSESYPSDNNCSTTPPGTICLKASAGTTFQYIFMASTSSYCLSATNDNITYRYSSLVGSIEEGDCVANTFNNLAWQLQTTNFPGTWYDLDVSEDGTQMIASVSPASFYVFTSTDSGATWTQRTVPVGTARYWNVAISGDGRYMLAGASMGEYMYVSSDFGVTWGSITSGGTMNWYDVDISNNGQGMYGARSTGGISVSSDYGATWAVRTVAGNSSTNVGVVTSEDGMHVLANRSDRSLWYSGDRGVTWVARTITNVTFYSMAISGDGSRMLVSGTNSADGSSNIRRLYTSTDFGATWTELTAMGTGNFDRVTLSIDGTKAVTIGAPSGLRFVYVSKDFGSTWTQQSSLGTASWSNVRMSATGAKIFVTKSTEFRAGTYD